MQKYIKIAGIITFFCLLLWLIILEPFGPFTIIGLFSFVSIVSLLNLLRNFKNSDKNQKFTLIFWLIFSLASLFDKIDRVFRLHLDTIVFMVYVALASTATWLVVAKKRLAGLPSPQSPVTLHDETH